jgi:hypothetical protein
MVIVPEEQPYLMRFPDGRNVPMYKSSLIPRAEFYATGARLEQGERLRLATFLVKGDREGYCYKTGEGGEVLRVGRVSMLSPETVFVGFILAKEPLQFPKRIRLGRYRSPARLSISYAGRFRYEGGKIASHPVDPLVSRVTRGVLVPILPYPLVERGYVERCIEAEFGQRKCTIAIPDSWWVEGESS